MIIYGLLVKKKKKEELRQFNFLFLKIIYVLLIGMSYDIDYVAKIIVKQNTPQIQRMLSIQIFFKN